ncbi:hypothetical protein PRIC1_011737 [Phytophthora ramorum]
MKTTRRAENETLILPEMLELLANFDTDENEANTDEQESRSKKNSIDRTKRQRTSRVSTKGGAKDLSLVPYSTELQRRKRLELRTLKAKALEMEMTLAQLEKTHRENMKKATERSHSTRWRSFAAITRAERQRAEQRNRGLKAILADQTKVYASIGKFFEKKDVLKEMDFVFQLEVDRPLLQLEFSAEIVEIMTEGLPCLYRAMETELPRLDSETTVSIRCEGIPLGDGGKGMRISSITPLACTVQEAGTWIWDYTTKVHQDSGKYQSFKNILKTTPNPWDMNSMSTMRAGPQVMNMISTFRRYDEGSRTVLIGTAKWFLPDGSLLLQDYNWTVISPSPSDPVHSCVMQNCYKLEMASTLPSNAVEAQKAIMMLDTVGLQMRKAIQSMQDIVLTRMGVGGV